MSIGKTYLLRKAEKTDQTALVELSRNVINNNFRSFMGDEAVDGFINSGMADAEIISAMNDITVLEFEHKIIGLSIWKESLLHLLMVSPEYQGTGAAAHFITQMSEEKLDKYPEIHLECFEGNARANRFYEKCGWERYKVEMDTEAGINRYFYRKSAWTKRYE